MEKKIKYEDITIDERVFRLNKLDALTGSYLAFKLASKALPFGLSISSGVPTNATVEMSKPEFKEMQLDCLRSVTELVENMQIPILNENDSFRALDLEDNPKVVIALTIHVLRFNASSFFGESVLQELVKKFSDMNPFDAKI